MRCREESDNLLYRFFCQGWAIIANAPSALQKIQIIHEARGKAAYDAEARAKAEG
jgi:hypothetical protein